jgi:methylenetetrahydrofolate reductase (NADPH)
MKLHPPRARSRLLTGFSLETTAKDAERFLQIRQLVPEGAQVNIAFLGSETFDQRVAAIETLGACGAHPTPIISARRLESLDVLESFLAQAVRIGLSRIGLDKCAQSGAGG